MNENQVEQLKQVQKQKGNRRGIKKCNPEEVIQYGIETGVNIGEIAKHFNVSRVTIYKYIASAKKMNPDIVEQLKQVQKENRRRRTQKCSPEEVVKYGIETGASGKEMAEHFGISESTISDYIASVKKTNPELVKKLKQVQGRFSPEEVIQYGIETGSSGKEMAKHFGISEMTISRYLASVKKTNPDLVEQLKQARRKMKAQKIKESNLAIDQLKRENGEIKAYIVLLEQGLQGHREEAKQMASNLANETEKSNLQMGNER